ncbi:hypothetical protein KAZ01_03060, partial [Candidatus Gracilibacteria bacterium]|nr:hypothetical protein [Candidatus Gracilibacteria bacterium]
MIGVFRENKNSTIFAPVISAVLTKKQNAPYFYYILSFLFYSSNVFSLSVLFILQKSGQTLGRLIIYSDVISYEQC